MNQRLLFSLLALASIFSFSTSNCSAQETKDNPTFGIGVALFNSSDYARETYRAPSNTIIFTCNLGEKLRLEPTVNFRMNSFTPGQYEIGLGTFYRKSVDKFNILYGARVGYTSSGSNVISPTIGGEYFFYRKMSIAGEAAIRSVNSKRQWDLSSNTSILLRFYL